MSIKRRMRRLNQEEKPPEPVPKAAAKGKAAAKAQAVKEEEPKEKDLSGLPERQWQGGRLVKSSSDDACALPGIPKYELRSMLLGPQWPEDPLLPEAELETKKIQLTEPLKSFRTFKA